jgi:hypothetical protein
VCENGTRPVETLLRRQWGVRMKRGRVNLKYIVSTFINVTMCPQYSYNMLIKNVFFRQVETLVLHFFL